MEDRTIHIYFSYEAEEEPNISLSFDTKDSKFNIYQFHDFCKKFAAVIGFVDSNIEEVFGETTFDI